MNLLVVIVNDALFFSWHHQNWLELGMSCVILVFRKVKRVS